jgi:hypothetical protein
MESVAAQKVGRRLGINPVWYVDITPGRDWLMNPINQLIEEGIAAGGFDGRPIARLAPFIEQMGTGTNAQGQPYRKEFWWEREWRHVGNLALPARVIVLCPENEFAEFEPHLQWNGRDGVLVDPTWGLEQIIARLAGFNANDTDML